MATRRQVSLQKTSQSRVFLIEDRAGPSHAPDYMGLARAMGVDWAQGDRTPVRIPSEDAYGLFDTVDIIKGAQGLPTMPIEVKKTRAISEMLKLVRKGCEMDVQVHIGACRNPTDFNQGWELIAVLEGGGPTNYGTGELGALDFDQDAVVMETIPLTGLNYYELKNIVPSEIASTELVQKVVDVAICDSRTCGACGIPSDGCQKVFAITLSAGGSPGLPAELIASEDGGATWVEQIVTTLGANEDPNALACVGSDLVIISEDDEALHYAPIVDVLAGTATFTRVSTGFTALKGPLGIFSLGRTKTWIVGEGGYIYFSDDIRSGVDIQSAGGVTAQDLNAISGVSDKVLVAVGGSNAVVFTDNGGLTWSSITGPDVGVALNAVEMLSENTWFVGTDSGKLWYTIDAGAHWTEKTFPGSGAGSVRDIKFATPTVGYMAHDTATPVGRVLRSIDGGFSWYVLPETGSMPDNDQIAAIAACSEDPNVVYAGGLGANSTDGFLVKFA